MFSYVVSYFTHIIIYTFSLLFFHKKLHNSKQVHWIVIEGYYMITE